MTAWAGRMTGRGAAATSAACLTLAGIDFSADPAGALARPAALDGASVRVIPLDRGEEAARQDAARERLWAPFFDASGAAAIAWDPTG